MDRIAIILALGFIMLACIGLDAILFQGHPPSGIIALIATVVGGLVCLIAAFAPDK